MFKDTLQKTDLVPEITVTGLTSFLNHDGYAYNATIKLNGKKICEVTHEGMGGMMDIRYTPNGEDAIEKYVKKNNLTQHMFDNGWEFMEDVAKISKEDVLEAIVEDEISNKETKKLISRYQAKGLVIGTKGSDEFARVSWKYPLKKYVDAGQTEGLKKAIAKRISELKPNEFLLNTNLEKLGLI